MRKLLYDIGYYYFSPLRGIVKKRRGCERCGSNAIHTSVPAGQWCYDCYAYLVEKYTRCKINQGN